MQVQVPHNCTLYIVLTKTYSATFHSQKSNVITYPRIVVMCFSCWPAWTLDLISLFPTLGHRLWLNRRPAWRHHRQSEAAVQRQSDQAAVLHAALLLFRLLCPVLVHQTKVIGGSSWTWPFQLHPLPPKSVPPWCISLLDQHDNNGGDEERKVLCLSFTGALVSVSTSLMTPKFSHERTLMLSDGEKCKRSEVIMITWSRYHVYLK